MNNTTIDREAQGSCPVYVGGAVDRLSHWCHEDSLQQEDAVLAALAMCREVLHALPGTTRPDDTVAFPAGAVATLVGKVQSDLSHTAQCSR